MLYVCLSQIRKCLLIHETITSEQNTQLHFEKVCVVLFLNLYSFIIYNYNVFRF